MGTEKKPRMGIGFRVGRLTVMESTDQRKNGYMVWNCRCDCGGSILLDTRTLQRGSIRDCGCETKVKPGRKDLTGKRFGRLVCLTPDEKLDKNGSTQWVCRCDCGKMCVASTHQLVNGYKKSCGCMRRPPIKDFVGRRFGKLAVMEYAGKQAGMHRWRCLCDCGKETVVGQTLLQNGKTKSCGCLQNSIIKDNMKFVDGTSVAVLENTGTRLSSSNTSGYNGVYRNRKTQKWIAQIGFKGKTYYLGSFSKIEDAAEIRKKAEDRLYGEFLDWYYSIYPEQKPQKE